MPQVNFYVNVDANQLIQATTLATPVSAPPPLFFGDTIPCKVQLFTRNPTPPTGGFPLLGISTAGLTLFMYIDDDTVTPGTIYTQQIIWTADPTQTFFTANLALNTAALATLLGGNHTAQATLKIGYVLGGLPTTVLSIPVTIGVGIPNAAAPTVPAGQTALSQEVAAQEFVAIRGAAGNGFILTSPAGKQLLVQAVDNADGTVSFDSSLIS